MQIHLVFIASLCLCLSAFKAVAQDPQIPVEISPNSHIQVSLVKGLEQIDMSHASKNQKVVVKVEGEIVSPIGTRYVIKDQCFFTGELRGKAPNTIPIEFYSVDCISKDGIKSQFSTKEKKSLGYIVEKRPNGEVGMYGIRGQRIRYFSANEKKNRIARILSEPKVSDQTILEGVQKLSTVLTVKPGTEAYIFTNITIPVAGLVPFEQSTF